MRKIIILAVCLLSAPALAQKPAPRLKLTVTQAQTDPLAVLRQFSLPDVNAALEDAQSRNDPVSTPCWQALHDAITNLQAPVISLPKGIFSAIQKARDLKLDAEKALSGNSVLTTINIACAPLILDGQNTLILLGIGAGAIAGTGGIGLPVLAPGILSLIPK